MNVTMHGSEYAMKLQICAEINPNHPVRIGVMILCVWFEPTMNKRFQIQSYQFAEVLRARL